MHVCRLELSVPIRPAGQPPCPSPTTGGGHVHVRRAPISPEICICRWAPIDRGDNLSLTARHQLCSGATDKSGRQTRLHIHPRTHGSNDKATGCIYATQLTTYVPTDRPRLHRRCRVATRPGGAPACGEGAWKTLETPGAFAFCGARARAVPVHAVRAREHGRTDATHARPWMLRRRLS